jgi:hypothetical protein
MLARDPQAAKGGRAAWPALVITAVLIGGCASPGPTVALPSPSAPATPSPNGSPADSAPTPPGSAGASSGPSGAPSAGPAQASPSAGAPSVAPSPAKAAWRETGA